MRPFKLAAYSVGVTAAIGAIGSVLVHVMARCELTPPHWHRTLHPGMLVMFIVTVPIFQRLALASPHAKGMWSIVVLRAPRWMRMMVNGAAAYCGIELGVFALKDALGGIPTTPSQELEMFSAGWIALYLSVVSIAHSYLQLSRRSS
jgi:hypothetical protein